MRLLYNISLLLLGIIFTVNLSAQVNIYNLGSEILIKNNTVLTIKGNIQNEDSVFYNLGTVTISGDIINNAYHLFPDQNNGSVIFTGDSVQYIKGTGNTVWFNVLRTQSSDTIKLQLPINVFDSLSMENGYILLNGKELNLDNSSSIYAMGFLHGETNNSRIIGDTGYIKVKYLAFQPVSKNIAGIGVSMSSSGNYGTSTIKRFHQQQQILDESIDKVYTFDFSNSNSSNVHIDYLSGDYNPDSLKESDFTIWKSTNLGSTYSNMGGIVNKTNNYVDVFGITMEDSWLTVAPQNCRDVPPLDLGGDSLMICKGDTAHLIAGDNANGYTYLWNDNTTDSSISTTSTGMYWVKVTNPKGCYSIDTIIVMHYPEPVASFMTDNICERDSTYFINQSYVIGDIIVGFHWDFGNGDTSNYISAVEVFDTAGIYSVNLIATTYSGCSDDTTINLTAYATPHVGFTESILCDNYEITFTDTSNIVSPYGVMGWDWYLDSIHFSYTQDTTYNFSSSGDYDIKLVAMANTGCKDSLEKTITINANDTASFTATDVCIGTSTIFTNTSSFTGSGLNYKYLFDDNDSSLVENPNHTFNTVGTHTDTLIVFYNGGQCSDTAIGNSEVFDDPFIDFGSNISSCDSYTLDALNPGCTYLWSDNTTASTLIVTATGNYSVTITNANNCQYIDSVDIVIFQSPTPNLGIDTSVCASLQLDAGYSGSTYQWSSGQSSQTINITATNNYIVTVTDQNNCSGTDNIYVTVSPFPVADFSVTDVCLGQSSDFTNQSTLNTGNIASYNWSFGDASNSNLQNPSHIYGDDIIYSVQLEVVSDSGCADNITKTTSIRPLPIIGFSSAYLCNKQEINFTDTSTVVSPYLISSRQWDFDNGQGSTLANPTEVFAMAGNYNVQLIGTTSFGCIDSLTKQITVNQTDSLSFTANDVCLNDITTFNNTSTYSEPNLSWSWNFDDNSISSDSSTTHLYSNTGVYNVSLIVNYSNGQCYDTLIQSTEVFQNPFVNLGGNVSSCNSYTLDALNPGSTYLWSDNSTNQTLVVTSSGNYSVTITKASSCSYIDSVDVIIYPNPTPDLGSDSTLCGSYTLDAGYNGSTYQWSNSQSSQTINITSTNTYAVTVTDQYNCSGSDSVFVTINPYPTANFSITDVCLNQNSSFTNSSTLSSGNILSNAWNFGDGNSSSLQNPTHLFANATTYNVQLKITSDAGCSDSISKSTNIKPLPIVGFTSSYLCNNQKISFTDTSSVVNPYSITNYNWNFDNGHSSALSNPTETFSNSGKYDVKLICTTSFGCIDSTISALTVNQTDSLSFTASDVCLNETTILNNTSTYSDPNQTWSWNFGDNNISSDSSTTHLYSNSGTYNVSLVVNYGGGQCYDTLIQSTEVFQNPSVNLGGNVSACNSYNLDAQNSGSTYHWNDGSSNQTLLATSSGNYSVTITNANSCQFIDSVDVIIYQNPSPNLGSDSSICGSYVLDAGYSGSSFQWSSGQSSQTVTATTSNTYSVTVTDQYNCSGSDSVSITINPFPVANFYITDVCQGQNSNFNDSSTISTGSIMSYSWDFDDGGNSNIQNPNHIFADDITYNVQLNIQSNAGCSDSISKSTNIKPLPIVGFTSSYLCNNQEISFTDTSSVVNPYSITNYNWDFDNGQSSALSNPTETFSNSGTYDVKLICTTSFGCIDSTISTLTVNQTDSLSFTASDVCLNETTILNNTSTYSDPNQTWSWNFGDNSISSDSSTTHIYSNIGSYNVSLVVNYGSGQCYDTLVQSTEVFDNPSISFGDSIFTCGTQYVLDAQNSGSTYLWNDNSTAQTITATTNGDYSVTITNSNSCSFVDSVYIGLNSAVIPNLGPDTSSCGSLQLNANYAGSTFNWNTGDSTQFIDANSSGFYKVTVTDANGCSGSDSINIQINPIPIASFSTQNTCLNTTSIFLNTSSISSGNIDSYLYDFGDNTSSNLASPNHVFANSGNYQVNLTITSDSACIKDTSIIHSVYSLPIAGFSTATICDNYEVTFTDTSIISNAYNITNYDWDFDNSMTSIAQDTTINYSNTGTYNVSLTVTSNVGCSDTTFNAITINLNDTVDFNVANVCSYDSSIFNNTTTLTGAIQWQWSFGNGNNSSLENPKELYGSAGNYTVSLVATYNNGQCTDSISKSTEIYAIPQLNFSDTTESCQSTYTLDAQNFGSTYLWSDNSTNQTLILNTDGNYWVKVTNQNSCINHDTSYLIFHTPVIPNLGADTSLCNSLVLDANYSGSVYNWNTGETLQQISADTSGLYKVTITDANGCSGSDSINVTINPIPVAAFTTQHACQKQGSIFQDISSISSGTISTYLYDFGDNISSSLASPNHNYASPGNYQVQLTITSDSGCVNDTSIIHSVYENPIAGFQSTTVCDNFEVTFTDTSKISNAYNITDYYWDFDNSITSIAQDTSINFANTGTYNISLVATSNVGCSDTATTVLQIIANDTIGFSTNNICLNDSANFINTSSLTGAIQWQWRFGNSNTSNLENPTELYTTSGIYNVQLVATYNNGQCADTLTQNLEVFALPQLNFSATVHTCSLTYIIDAQNVGSNYLWSDNSTSQTLAVTQSGIYYVKVTDNNGCINTDTSNITFKTHVTADLGADTSSCGILLLDAANTGSTFSWNTGETTQSINADTSGMYKVSITGANGCTASDSVNIHINPIPIAAFITQNSCQNTGSSFQNISTISSGTISSYLYDFDDNSTSNVANTTHQYASAGNYQVQLTVTSDSACVKDTTIIHTVYEAPIAGFQSSTLCDNFEVLFTDTSSISNAYTITNYEWDFDNGSSSIAHDTTINFANAITYNVSLIASSNMGCMDTTINAITINPNDSANFSVANACLNDTSYFNNLSTFAGVVLWHWDFGNGDSSVQEIPNELYSNSGNYIIELVANYNNGQCFDTAYGAIDILTLPQINFTDTIETCATSYTLDAQNPGSTYFWSNFSSNQTLTTSNAGTYHVQVTDTNGCVNSDTTLLIFNTPANADLGPDTSSCGSFTLDAGTANIYNWSTGDTTQQLVVNQSGIYSVEISTLAGCMDSDTVNVQIFALPNISLGADIDTCNADSVLLSVGTYSSYLWSNNDTTADIYVSQSGDYWISVRDVNNCTAVDSINITLHYLQTLNIADSLYICPGEDLIVNPNASGATINWLGPNNFSHTADSVLVSDVGTYYVEAQVLSCTERDTFEVLISNMAMIAQFLSSSDVETMDSIQFIELSHPDPIHFYWDFDDGTSDTVADPIHLYYLEDTYYVSLIAENSECSDEIIKPIIVTDPPKGPSEIIDKEAESEKVLTPFIKILKTNLYPNPNNGIFRVDVELSAPSNSQLGLFDITGKMIYLKDFTNQDHIIEKFNFNSLNQGYYIMVFRTINETKTFKIAVVR